MLHSLCLVHQLLHCDACGMCSRETMRTLQNLMKRMKRKSSMMVSGISRSHLLPCVGAKAVECGCVYSLVMPAHDHNRQFIFLQCMRTPFYSLKLACNVLQTMRMICWKAIWPARSNSLILC